MKQVSQYKTSNTFSHRPVCQQIICYLVVIFENISFWLFVQSNYLSQVYRLTMITLFSTSLFLIVILGCITSSLDPSDPVMKEYRGGNSSKISDHLSKCVYCENCHSYVYLTSKHCKICDRCVHQFDHHCVWINNCIGLYNYRAFLGLIVSAYANLTIYLISTVLLWIQGDWHSFMSQMAVNWVMGAVALILSLMVLGLIILHCFLVLKGVTTYDFIVSKRVKEAKSHKKIVIHSMNQIQQAAKPINQSFSENNHTEEVHKTQNLLHPSNFNQSFNRCHQKDKTSQLASIDNFKDSQDSKSRAVRISKDIKNSEEKTLEQFYANHRSLKILVGKTILVQSTKSHKGDKNKRAKIKLDEFQNQEDKVVQPQDCSLYQQKLIK